MAQPYIGEIRMFGGNFNPNGWAFCDGQLMPISENETLFQLIGTTYGGDGDSTFALPNLQSRVPIHSGTVGGTTYVFATQGGVETVTLTQQQLPIHNHTMLASLNPGSSQSPGGSVLALPTSSQPNILMYGADSAAAMSNASIRPEGGSQPHENCQPFLCVNYIISLFGIFPSQT